MDVANDLLPRIHIKGEPEVQLIAEKGRPIGERKFEGKEFSIGRYKMRATHETTLGPTEWNAVAPTRPKTLPAAFLQALDSA